MNPIEIVRLSHDQIPGYVESQVASGRDRATVIKEIAALRNDVVLLSVHDDKETFKAKVAAASGKI
ncbi:hypothetical protein [Chroococcidiopsis sp. TS-821]|uniref:hypothetical protein n=1 Tax=Chroococcidiopsis sp. TS-821 TaxID=1378066 RepID=UPI000CEDA3A6|nr:hypothetical protein [Chroococcidiopsis sp. TS-821]PPS45111.1 hypothetical protein B1A85_02235 [Chroococcidiopsis sp. TS-821]